MKFAMTAALAAVVVFGALAHAASAPAPLQYDDYRTALMAFVDANGQVDYAGLKDQRVYLDDFITSVERLTRSSMRSGASRTRSRCGSTPTTRSRCAPSSTITPSVLPPPTARIQRTASVR